MTTAFPGRVTIERFPYDPVSWDAIAAAHPEAEVYHGPGWLAYLEDTQGAEIVTAAVRQDGQQVGYLVGGVVRRYGLRILGTPMSGWTTPRMGFLLRPGADRVAAARALRTFAYRNLGCIHVELGDMHLSPEDAVSSGYAVEAGRTFLVDLMRPEDEILKAMNATTRNYVRQALRKGLVVERPTGEGFAAEFHPPLAETFARQGLRPTYDEERVRKLIRHLEPRGEVLLQRVRAADGQAVAWSIAVGTDRKATLWGAAFVRSRTDIHPNEILHWEEMRYWRSRGASTFDFGGGGDYKAKYGGVETPSARYTSYRLGALRHGRDAARRLFQLRQAMSRGRHQPDAVAEP